MSVIYHLLDQILPHTGKPKQDILRLEHLSGIKILDTECEEALEVARNLPSIMYDYGPVLQAQIQNYYLKYINSLEPFSSILYASLTDIDITFPEAMAILILNWPHESFNVSNQLSSLEPPVGIFHSRTIPSQPQVICDWSDMLQGFRAFSSRLIEFTIQSVMKYVSASNTQGQKQHLLAKPVLVR